MKFYKESADCWTAKGASVTEALVPTTHLGIGAHQDDLEVMAFHGILECFGSEHKNFSGVVCTDGAGSPRAGIYAKYSDEEMQTLRRAEQRKAAEIGQYAAMIQLNYASSEIKAPLSDNLIADLETVFKEAKPEYVYTHNLADKHDTHVAVALSCIEAIRKLEPKERPHKLYGCEVWRDLDWLSDEEKIALPISGRENIAMALLGIYDSQITGGKRYDLATVGRRRANATYFQSHGVDQTQQLAFAMDLSPLIQQQDLDVAEYVLKYIDDFKESVKSKLFNLNIK